jgi:tetratricopeptide (TPR) repeat protein
MQFELRRKKKGSVVQEIVPWQIICFAPDPAIDGVLKTLPREIELKRVDRENRPCTDDPEVEDFIRKAENNGNLAGYAVSTSLHVLLGKNGTPTRDDEIDSSCQPELLPDEEDLVAEAWVFVSSLVTWSQWVMLYCNIRKRLCLISKPHSLISYAGTILPKLTTEELNTTWEALRDSLGLKYKSSENAFFTIAREIEDQFSDFPVVIGVLPFNPAKASQQITSHSCLPNVVWDLNSDDKFQLIALYDIASDESKLFASLVDTSLDLTARSEELRARYGQHFDCDCIRCQTERLEGRIPSSIRDLVRMGHLSFQNNRYEDAKRYYKLALNINPTLADISHAIGALWLAQNRFLSAQEHWRDAAAAQPAFREHEGIALQLRKQQAYRYFDSRRAASLSHPPSFTTHFDGLCFMTKGVASEKECTDIIASVDSSGDWTTSRHYAVPTNDIPVHQLSPALLDWFNGWMDGTVAPLLACQFKMNSNDFYVHDAFVVRYHASKSNNYLPIHLDESTHSFVLALNDNFSGGGTYFVDFDRTLVPTEPGTMVSFRGDLLRHGGNLVTNGVRYILAVFLYHDDSRSKKRYGASREGRSTFNEAKKAKTFSFEFSLESQSNE